MSKIDVEDLPEDEGEVDLEQEQEQEQEAPPPPPPPKKQAGKRKRAAPPPAAVKEDTIPAKRSKKTGEVAPRGKPIAVAKSKVKVAMAPARQRPTLLPEVELPEISEEEEKRIAAEAHRELIQQQQQQESNASLLHPSPSPDRRRRSGEQGQVEEKVEQDGYASGLEYTEYQPQEIDNLGREEQQEEEGAEFSGPNPYPYAKEEEENPSEQQTKRGTQAESNRAIDSVGNAAPVSPRDRRMAEHPGYVPMRSFRPPRPLRYDPYGRTDFGFNLI